MNKQFTHGGYSFNIKVELNSIVEKRIDGERLHTVTCNCTDAWNYYDKRKVNNQTLIETIKDMEIKAKHEVDLRNNLHNNKSELENQLIQLGFTY